MKEKIFIIEDDEDINELLVYNLKKENFQVKSFLNSFDALKELEKEKPDLLILDIMLPDIDGIEVCKRLRASKEFEDIPIIMLTAKSTEIDKVVGLELGADDYITKPFSFKELTARIRAILRRYSKKKNTEPSSRRKYEDLEIDHENFSVKIKDKKVPLTAKEFKLLNYLISNPNKVRTREQILEKVWNEKQYDVYDRTIDVHITKLRNKLGEYGKHIKTVHGIGYQWVD
jgi:DNA-binding response OmpR family regulator